jgi:hypothetical protein
MIVVRIPSIMLTVSSSFDIYTVIFLAPGPGLL